MSLALLIPRVEWGDQVMNGTLHSNTTVDGIASTATLENGMGVTGTNIPSGTTIIVVDANTVTLSQAATGSLNQELTFFSLFEFTYPPSSDDEGQQNANIVDSKSLSGEKQRQLNYMEEVRKLTVDFIAAADRATLKTSFYQNWAVFGNTFRWFSDKTDLLTYDTYDMNKAAFPDNRQVKKFPSFLYQIMFEFRKTL